MQAQNRHFDPYERNQLYKYGLNPDQFSAEIQTPVEYLTGHLNFRGQDFQVTPDVLIPRVETEALVDLVLKHVAGLDQPYNLKVADVGTGSGAIGLSLALELSPLLDRYEVMLGDVSDAALSVAQHNAHELLSDDLIKSKVSFVHSDLLTRFPQGPFDLIVANLPYIPSSRIAELDASVKDHEPHLALDGGDDGLDLISLLVSQAEDYLSDTGHIFLEIDHTHTAEELAKLSKAFKVEVLPDEAGLNRFAHLSRVEKA